MIKVKYVGKAVLNVRKEPSYSAEVVRTMEAGTEEKATEAKNGWYHVKGGWVNAAKVDATEVSEEKEEKPKRKAKK